MLIDNPFDRSDLYVPYVMSDKELAGLFATSVYQKFSDNVNRDGHWLGNEAYIALNVDYEKTETFQTGKSVFEFLAYEADQISSGNFDKSFLFGQTAKVADDITSTTPEQVKVKLEKVKKDADNYRENTSKEDMIVDAANMTADLLYGTATGGALTRSTKLSNKLFGYDDKDIDLNGTKSPDLFDLRHSNKGTLDGGILRTVDGDFSIKYGSVIRGQSKIDDARIDEIFRNPITGGYSKNISAKSGSPANYSINSGKSNSDNDTSAQVRKSIEANRLAYQHTPKNNGGDAPTPSQRPDAGRGGNASPVVPPSRGSVGGGVAPAVQKVSNRPLLMGPNDGPQIHADLLLARQQFAISGNINVKNFDFGAHLRALVGDAPVDMPSPHAHHILFKQGLGEKQKRLVAEGQALLKKYEIDPILGQENLIWAPNRIKGQHDIIALRSVVDTLKMTDEMFGTREDMVSALRNLGRTAAERR